MTTLEKAIQIAVSAHQGQKDKAGAIYILHPLRLMLRMETEEEKISAVLHDVIEDTSWTLDDLRKEGFSENVVKTVDYLSRWQSETFEEYIDRLKDDPMARKIKIADLEDNMDLKRLESLTQIKTKKLAQLHNSWVLLKKIDKS